MTDVTAPIEAKEMNPTVKSQVDFVWSHVWAHHGLAWEMAQHIVFLEQKLKSLGGEKMDSAD